MFQHHRVPPACMQIRRSSFDLSHHTFLPIPFPTHHLLFLSFFPPLLPSTHFFLDPHTEVQQLPLPLSAAIVSIIMKSIFSKKGFEPARVKANVKMAVTRIRMQQNKLVNSVKIQRRQIAELLAIEKYDSARIKVESALREDVSIEGLEVLALFLELVANRIQLIQDRKTCPPELKEALTSIMWASARWNDTITELTVVRESFEAKFGKPFVMMGIDNSEYSVNQKMMDRLGLQTPTNERCISYLAAIAAEYNLDNFDEDKLRDPNGVVSSSSNNNSGANGGVSGGGMSMSPGGPTTTPSGLVVPPIDTPEDDIEVRLLQLKRQ